MATVNEYEALSKAVYGGGNESVLSYMPNWEQLDLPGYGKYFTNSNGFAGAVYYNSSTNELVIAIRGTNDLQDAFQDGKILNQQSFSQVGTTTSFYEYIASSVLPEYSNLTISVTGHSLGGALAGFLGSETGFNTVTFNAPGVNYLNPGVHSNVTNYVVMNDIVGTFGDHIGNVYVIPPVPMEAGALSWVGPHNYIPFSDPFSVEAQVIPNYSLNSVQSQALWFYDVNNQAYATNLTQQLGIQKPSTSTLNQAINTLENLHQYIQSVLHYRTDAGDIILGTDNADGSDSLTGSDSHIETYYEDGQEFQVQIGGNDTIYGNDGDDKIDGLSGADAMYGGTGDDNYYVDDAGDIVSESADEGQDIVRSSISYNLTANVEDLVLTGSGNTTGAGNNLDNHIIGNDGNNKLNGLAGNDYLYGNEGNDTLIGGSGSDYLYGGDGSDIYLVSDGSDSSVITTIMDEDGQGQVYFKNYKLTDAQKISDNVYQDTRGNIFTLNGDVLTVSNPDIAGQIQINNFNNGDLGIAA